MSRLAVPLLDGHELSRLHTVARNRHVRRVRVVRTLLLLIRGRAAPISVGSIYLLTDRTACHPPPVLLH